MQAKPHQIVQVSHSDPDGKDVPWAFPDGGTHSEDGEPITTKKLGADPCGRVTWKRPGTLDVEGSWTARVTFDPYSETPETTGFPYTMHQLELEGQGTLKLWAELTGIEGGESTVYYSDSVPTALALDIQSRLTQTADLMQDRLSLTGIKVPDLYLLGSATEYDQVKRYIGGDPGWEAGFYRRPCLQCSKDRPGLYLRAYVFGSRANLHKTLTHEYAHALVDQATNGKGEILAAWVNEGLADWAEYEIVLPTDNPQDILRLQSFQVDEARSAAMSGRLFALSDLESRHSWNGRSGAQVDLQYAQAYMAMRYLIETYGAEAAVTLVKNKARGYVWSLSMKPLGVGYGQFESDFVVWLKSEEPSDAPYERGKAHYDAGEYDKAVDEYSAAIDLNPHRDWYFRSRGWAYERLDQDESALQDASQAIQIDPGEPDGYNLRGWAFYGLERYEEAIADFSRAIELNPLNNYYRGRGNAYDRLAQYEQALADFGRAIRLDPNYALTYRERGWTYYRTDRYEDALQDANQAVKLEPGDRWNYRLRGRALAKLERYAEAVSDFSRAIDLHPHEVIYFDRGRAHYKLAQYDRALADFGEAIRIDPNYAFAYDWRAAAHGKLGNEAQKLADRQSACSIDNSFWFC